MLAWGRRQHVKRRAGASVMVAASLVVASLVAAWLCVTCDATARADEAAAIRMTCRSFDDAMREAANAYKREHTGAEFESLRQDRIVNNWFNGSVDLFATHGWLYHIMKGATQQRFEQMSDGMSEHVLGYAPVVAVVHPDNPVDAISMDQLRLIRKMPRVVSWQELGWDEGGDVTRWIQGVFDTVWALQYDESGQAADVPDELKHPDEKKQQRTREEMLAAGRQRAAQMKRSHTIDELLQAVAKDRRAIAIVKLDDKVLASGLKMLQVHAGDASKPVAMTPRAVADGTYPLRLAARLYVHPQASDAVKRFVTYLASDAGQAMLARHRIYNRGHAPDLSITNTPGSEYTATWPDAPAVQPRPAWVGPIDGAVALLPTKMVSPYFLMAGAAHQELYEQAIFAGIAADGRLSLVDRQRMDALLRERQLQTLDVQRQDTPGPLVAADILVVPTIMTRGANAFLRIVALHAPTAAVLDSLDVPLDGQRPARFDQPLDQIIRQWWPHVLSALHAARTQPRWHLFAATTSDLSLLESAQQTDGYLLAHLRSRHDVLSVAGPVISDTQREVLMRLIGMSRDRAGGFTPLFDYLVQGRQVTDTQLQLTVSDANFEPIESTTIVAKDGDDRLRQARQWLDAQMHKHRSRLSDGLADDSARRNGARLQSRMAWNAAMELGFAYVDHIDKLTRYVPSAGGPQNVVDYAVARSRMERYARRSWTYRLAVEKLGGSTDALAPVPRWAKPEKNHSTIAAPERIWLTDAKRRELIAQWTDAARQAANQYATQAAIVAKYKKQGLTLNASYDLKRPQATNVSNLHRQYWQHIERAGQLDPTWQRAAYMLATVSSAIRAPDVESRFVYMKRYLADFPDSKSHEVMLYDFARFSLTVGEKMTDRYRDVPPTVDRIRMQQQYMRQGLDAYFTFLQEYVLPDRMTGPYMPGKVRYQHYWHLLAWIERFLRQCNPSEDVQQQIIAAWAKRFDEHPTEAPHSDFVRLVALGVAEKHNAFFNLLADLQQRWPKPNGLPWSFVVQQRDRAYTYNCVGENVTRLISRIDGDQPMANMFDKWLHGKLAVSQLPWTASDFRWASESEDQ